MLTLLAAAFTMVPSVQPTEVDLIAFGSCAREREEQPIWTEIIARRPDLFLFIGDNQYADFWEDETGKITMHPVTKVERLHEAYAALAGKPGFIAMRETCPVLATWDDHDYGANDGGREYALREQSREIFLDFWGFPADDAARKHEGVYHARTYGPEGRRVQVIMLDTRYNRDALETGERQQGRGPYLATPDTSKTMLGEAQWAWLGERLREPAEVRVIASSIQVVADEHGYETWGNMPHERERLYRLIDEADAAGVVLISGDRHLMEISRDTEHGAPYPMWDFTSSGMTQRPGEANDPNRYRVGEVKRETNYGVIEIAWGEKPADTVVTFVGYGAEGKVLMKQSVPVAELAE